jgi:putative tryptophan/tyrosine transport system substrate-binding protein
MRRREFLAILGGAVAPLWPLAPRAQQRDSLRRLGVLFVLGEDQVRSFIAALKDGLQRVGWAEGQTLHVDMRFCRSDPRLVRRYTDELLSLKPDVVLAQGVVGAAALKQATASVPVVFVQVQDPVGGGFVTSLSRPDGNLTGFTNFDYEMAGKWLELLKELSPKTTRALALINPDNRARWNGYSAAFHKFAPALGISPLMAGVHDAGEIERAIVAFAEEPNGGLVALPDATIGVQWKLITDLAVRHRLPAVYSSGNAARMGGLAAYGDNVEEQYRRAASYVDRLLRGARPGDLPVQATERFETVLNLKTAAALGIAISPALLARADEVIE